jgi:hypothetical protein
VFVLFQITVYVFMHACMADGPEKGFISIAWSTYGFLTL